MRFHIIHVQVLKELDQFRRDRLTVALAFVLPVAAMLMYGFATRLEAQDMPVVINNLDSGKASRELVDRIYASLQLIPAKTVRDSLLSPLDQSKAKAVITIPPDFSRSLQANRTATIQAIIDGADVNNARVIKNGLLAITQRFEADLGLQNGSRAIKPETRLWYNPGRKESLYIVPGAMGLVLWVFPALLSTLTLAREKEQGTILQVFASNMTATEFIGGKAVAYLLIALGEFSLLALVAYFLFGLRFRAEPITFMLITVLYLAAAVLFGLLAATRANNQMAAVQIVANVGFLGAMLLSGFIYPLRNIAYPLSLFCYLVPTMYYVVAARNAFVRGGDWSGLWYAPAFLLVFDALLLLVLSKAKMKLTS